MVEPTASEIDLVAVDLAGPDAARAIRDCWDAREAVVVIDPALTEAAKFAVLRRLRPTGIIDSRGRRAMRGSPVPAGTAAVVVTSGTAATPKAVTLTRAGMETMAVGYSSMIGASGSDVWLAALPLTGVAGLAILARSYVTDVPAVVHDRFVSDHVARSAERHEASIVSLVPTALRRLLDAGAPLHHFRVVLVGGAPFPNTLRDCATAAGVTVVGTYGLTETWGGVALDGQLIGGAQAQIADDGEIEIAGPMVMSGYRLDPEATRDVFRDGWLRTGDLGTFTDDRLVVTGRRGDMIITGGVNVSPAAVEAALLTHAGIVDAAVVGAADEEWGERVVAYVVPADPAAVPSLEDVRALVKTELAAAAAPQELHPVSRIPRNASGKVVRRDLGRS